MKKITNIYIFSLVTHTSSLQGKEYEWRIPLGIQIVPSLILGIGILFFPYSPRWLVDHDREEEAKAVLMKIRSGSQDEIDKELNDINDELAELKEREIRSYIELIHSPILRPFLLGIGIQAFQQFTGINAIIYYAPQIFKQIGYNNQTSPLLATGISGCVNVVATIPTIIFIDKLGRRIVLIAGGIIMTISLLIVGILMGTDGHKETDLTAFITNTFVIKDATVSWAVIVFIYIFVAGFAFSWGPIPWIYCAEIYPLTMRAKATSLTTAANWATNCAVSFLVPILLEYIPYKTFIIFSILCAIMTGLVYLFYSETKDKTLEDPGIHESQPIFIPSCLRNCRRNSNTFDQENLVNEEHIDT